MRLRCLISGMTEVRLSRKFGTKGLAVDLMDQRSWLFAVKGLGEYKSTKFQGTLDLVLYFGGSRKNFSYFTLVGTVTVLQPLP